MPATPLTVVEARSGYHYDGTNSAELAQAIDDFTVVSETPQQLTFTSGGQNLTVARGGYVVAAGGTVSAEDVFANEDDFRDMYTDVSETRDHIHYLKTGPAHPATGDEVED